MPVGAIIALLSAIAPLVPPLVSQVQSIISEIRNKGELTPLALSQIHELAVSIHQQVVDAENARLNPATPVD